jgi:hypothetical protein
MKVPTTPDAPQQPTDPMENWLMKPSLEWLEQAEHGADQDRCKMIAAMLRDLWQKQCVPSETGTQPSFNVIMAERDAAMRENAELRTERDKYKGIAFVANMDKLEAERQLAEARKDAERYRWLRDKSPGQNEQPIVVTQARSGYHMKYIGPLAYADLDAAIDTALKEKP